jgi:hypothetical protein
MTDITDNARGPERIWRVKPWIPAHHQHGLASWPRKDQAGEGATEYVRADLAPDPQDDARVKALVEALRPFARHVDKATCKISMTWEDGDYKSTYTNTLRPQDFFNAADALAAFDKGGKNE